MPDSPTHRRGRATALTTAAIAVALLGACQSTVEVAPAPTASAPVCAEVLRALPEELAAAERRSTTSQASAAWGEDPAITFRCGVAPPGPTTDRCITAEAANGTSVDWVVNEIGDVDSGWRFTTYGRVPAIELTVPVERVGNASDADPTTLLVDIGEAVDLIGAERSCLALEDL
ncbi:DUF3515 domain-containing protein [Ruania suaedae]|uniref:DUF3515 family protein n=1 Tax=Ruania suaedae TaxID=2897774 RepID=UPI001E587355|nr:DUF3515 family protein [Ruania suaedae]UFU01989.1 DUF3515 domain-containing protein [Ruania suaedae]